MIHTLNQLMELSDAILKLELESEEDLERLEQLQEKQEKLIRELGKTEDWKEGYKDQIHALLRQEDLIAAKLNEHKQDASARITKMNTGNHLRNKYQQSLIQNEGYFVDRSK